MPPPYQTFQKFNDAALADVIAEKLQTQGIDYEITNEAPLLDKTFIGNDLGSNIHLKIDPADFNRAHVILEEYYQSQLQNIDPDYYLLHFSNQELLEILQKPDEWGYMDYALAKKLLADRGEEVTTAKAEAFRQERITELAKPEKVHITQIVLGYAAAIVALVGGTAGAFFGLYGAMGAMVLGYLLAWLKKTLPNGEKVYIYSDYERKHGKRIFWIAVIAIPVWFLMLLAYSKRIPFPDLF